MPFHIPYYFLYWNLPSVSNHFLVLTKKHAKKARKMSHFCTIVHVPDSDPYNGTCNEKFVQWRKFAGNVRVIICLNFCAERPRSWRRETDNKKRTSLTTRDYRGFNHLIRINSHLIRMTAFFWEEGSGKIYQSNLSGIICRNSLSGIIIPKAACCIFMKRLLSGGWGMLLWWHTFQHISLTLSYYNSNDCARWRKFSFEARTLHQVQDVGGAGLWAGSGTGGAALLR